MVVTNIITNGTTSIGVGLQYGYKTEIELAMSKTYDANGIIHWLDDGKRYDNYSTGLKLLTDNGEDLEKLMASSNTSNISIVPAGINYPFSMVFADQTMPITIADWSADGDRQIFGNTRQYSLDILPNVTDVYSSLAQSMAINNCDPVLDHWTISGIPFPFARWEQAINDKRRVIVFGGSNANIDDTSRQYGDIVDVKVNCEEEQARQILQFFCNVMRGTTKTLAMPTEYRIFGERYKGITSCQVRLNDSIFVVSHNGAKNVDVSFSLQMVGI